MPPTPPRSGAPACASRGWGWAAQLYATRSSHSWGIGDLADLRALGRWAAGLGASTILINPLSAPLPLRTQQSSPYYPSSRRFVNPLYLRIEDVPGAATLGGELERLAALGRALGADRVIDRARVFDLKMEALERLWVQSKAATDEVAVMIDCRDPLEICAAAAQVEWAGYVDSWKGGTQGER